MRNWLALVPIKQGPAAKSRLAEILDTAARTALMQQMSAHVLEVLSRCAAIERTIILSPERPEGWEGEWRHDAGRGLNQELTAQRTAARHAAVLVIHADLPLVSSDDVNAMLALANAQRIALATDRAGGGTNALAIADDRPFKFCFGRMSRQLHVNQAPAMPILQRLGLTTDIDTLDDLRFAQARGFRIDAACPRTGLIA